MAVERHYRMVGEESARQKREREERERREKLEAEEKAEKARKEAVVWRIVWFVCCIGWLVFTVSCGLPWYIVVVGSLFGGTLSMVLVWMTLHFNDKSSSGSGNFHISAPSKQTQRMLKRNIRRRWF